MRKRIRNSLFSDAAPPSGSGFPIVPTGDTVDRRLRSLMEHPLYHDPADDRLRTHVTQEFARAYPDAEAYDAAGRTLRSGPAIRPEDVRAFDPEGAAVQFADARTPDRQAARHGTAGNATLPQAIGRAIPTDTKIGAMETGGRLIGFDMAAEALRHYRGGSGEPLELPADSLRAHPAIRDAESWNQENLKQNILTTPDLRDSLAALKEGESLTRPLAWENKDIRADGFNDLHYASGKSNLDTTATLTFTRAGGNIRVEGDQTHRWRDVYDWQKDTSFLGGLVTGDEMLALENQGKAKPFDMHGTWSGPRVSGSIPIGDDGSLGEPEIDWSGGKQ